MLFCSVLFFSYLRLFIFSSFFSTIIEDTYKKILENLYLKNCLSSMRALKHKKGDEKLILYGYYTDMVSLVFYIVTLIRMSHIYFYMCGVYYILSCWHNIKWKLYNIVDPMLYLYYRKLVLYIDYWLTYGDKWIFYYFFHVVFGFNKD